MTDLKRNSLAFSKLPLPPFFTKGVENSSPNPKENQFPKFQDSIFLFRSPIDLALSWKRRYLSKPNHISIY